MSARGSGAWIILAGAVLLVLTVASAGPTPAGFWAPEGFVAQADTLIRRGGLDLRCGEQDSIAVRVVAGSPEEAFFDASYLRSDVRAFNRSPDATRSPFLVEGCRLVGVDPFYHRVDLPYNRLPRWRGDVLFTFDGTTATLEGGAAQVLELRHPVDRADAAGGARRVAPDEEGARAYTSLLRLSDPGSPEILADAFFVGDVPVLVDRRDVGSAEAVRVNGFRTPPGRMLRLGSGDWLQLVTAGPEPVPGASWTYLVETGDRARTASFVRVRNDRVDRLYPARRLEPLLRPFSQAMDLALQSVPGAAGSSVVTADVRLTVDRELSDALDERVATWCRDFAHPTRPRAVSALVMDAFTGAVVALPSCPGRPELAPFEPLSTRTRERFLRNQNLVSHPVGSAAKPFWTAAVATTWPNFLDFRIEPHPAGPADRVLGCELRAPYHDGHGSDGWTGLEEFLRRSCNRYQVELATAALALGSETTPDECRGPLAPAAFARCFADPLRTRVAAGVSGGATGTGGEAVGTGRVRFCDAVVTTVLSPGMDVVGASCDDLQLVDAAFDPGPALARLANVSVYRDPSPGTLGDGRAPALGDQYRLGRYRVDAWRSVLESLEAAGDTAHLASTALRFSSVSPQATNLALNTVEELRTDWVNLLLGGENSRWSNFELAEATARLVTGRAVRGTLADRVGALQAEAGGPMAGDGGGVADPSGDAPEAAPLLPADAIHPGVRRRVLHAMELVVGPGGTAGRLTPAVGRLKARLGRAVAGGPYDVWVFAKTGTPAVEKFVSSSQQRLVQRLHADGDVAWSGGRIRLGPGVAERIRSEWGEATLRWLQEDVFRPLERDPEAFRVRGGEPPPEHPLYLDEAGRLRARELTDLTVARQGGVLTLAVLAAPRAQGRDAAAATADWIAACPLDPGLRRGILEVPPAAMLDPERAVAVTAAVYLDDLAPGEGSGRAVDLALRIMDDLAEHVEKEIRRKAGR